MEWITDMDDQTNLTTIIDEHERKIETAERDSIWCAAPSLAPSVTINRGAPATTTRV